MIFDIQALQLLLILLALFFFTVCFFNDFCTICIYIYLVYIMKDYPVFPLLIIFSLTDAFIS